MFSKVDYNALNDLDGVILCSLGLGFTLTLTLTLTDNAHVHVTVLTANPLLALANEEHTDGDNAKLTAYEHEGKTVPSPSHYRYPTRQSRC